MKLVKIQPRWNGTVQECCQSNNRFKDGNSNFQSEIMLFSYKRIISSFDHRRTQGCSGMTYSSINPGCLFQYIFSSLCAGMGSRSTMIFLGTEVRQPACSCMGWSFYSFLQIGVTFALLQFKGDKEALQGCWPALLAPQMESIGSQGHVCQICK